jgi:hypothetical protein
VITQFDWRRIARICSRLGRYSRITVGLAALARMGFLGLMAIRGEPSGLIMAAFLTPLAASLTRPYGKPPCM